jgi:putative transposase
MYTGGMAKRQFQLSEIEMAEIRRNEQRTTDVHELKRLQGVRLYGTGLPMAQVMDITGSGESTIREWVQKYQQNGVDGLRSQWSGQNASKLSQEQRTEIGERLRVYRPDEVLPPEVRISQGQFWTVSDLQIVVEQWYGVTYKDQGSYRHLFHRCGFSYQRAEKVYKSRPSAADIAQFEAELEKK